MHSAGQQVRFFFSKRGACFLSAKRKSAKRFLSYSASSLFVMLRLRYFAIIIFFLNHGEKLRSDFFKEAKNQHFFSMRREAEMYALSVSLHCSDCTQYSMAFVITN